MSKIKAYLTGILCTITIFCASAQDGERVFGFLELPSSVRANALGGTNVSVIENDISLVFLNPAALGREMNMHANVNFLSYVSDIKIGSAIFGKSIKESNAFAVGVNYVDYGKFEERTAEDQYLGNFSAQDIAINGVYSHMLTNRLRGGVTAKFITSSYETYSSAAIGFDVGLSYYNEDREFSAGLVLKNMGSQIASYNDKRIGLPWDVQLGMSKRLRNAPIRLSLTARYLTQWNFTQIDEANGINSNGDSFLKTAFKHTVLGLDFLPSENFWVSLGFNPKVHYDMALQAGNQFGGLNAGAGLRIQKFNLGFAFANYHPAATSYHFSVGFDISKF